MMYHKAQLFSDATTAAQILSARHPRQVKALGRRVANFDEAAWAAAREAIVRRGNLLKFTRPVVKVQDDNDEEAAARGGGKSRLRERLLATGERELVEASPTDRIWGIGFGEARARAGTVGRERWGLNLLGKVLMEVRGLLREGESGRREEEGKGKGKEEEENEKEDGTDADGEGKGVGRECAQG